MRNLSILSIILIEVVIVSLESLVYICKVVGIYLNDFGQMVLSSETVGFKSCDSGQEFNSPWVQLLKMQKLEIVQSN
jgi:hypothetical protein